MTLPGTFDRGPLAKNSLIAASLLTKETALNTAATLSHSFPVALSSIPKLAHRREDDADEMTGFEEKTKLYNLGALMEMTMQADKMYPSVALLALAFGLGSVSTAAAGSGYDHTITPTTDMEPPTFTMGYSEGKQPLGMIRFAGCAIDTIDIESEADGWAKLTAGIKGTGYNDTDYTIESKTGAANSTSIELTNQILGDTPKNVHFLRSAMFSGKPTYGNVYSALSNMAYFSALGSVNSTISFSVLYRKAVAWNTFPARIAETPLRMSDCTFNFGGSWDGSAFNGGRQFTKELKNFKWTLNNNLEVKFVPGGTGNYAQLILRGGREQSLTVSRFLVDYLLKNGISQNETFGADIKFQGADYGSGNYYTVRLVFPKLGISDLTSELDGSKLSETATLQVLEHATYGSVIAHVKNLVATAAA